MTCSLALGGAACALPIAYEVLRVLAFITELRVTARILEHLA